MIGSSSYPTHSASSNENNTALAWREPTVESSFGTNALFHWFSNVLFDRFSKVCNKI